MMNEKKAIVLMSGGMDSAVCAAYIKDKGYSLAALHLNYGQRTQTRELDCFGKLSDYFGIEEKLIVDVSHLKKIGGSSLTDLNIEVNPSSEGSNEIPATYVPFRNGNIIAIAASWAEVIGAGAIVIGATQVDYSGYPDCRGEFFEAMESAINLGTKPGTYIKIITPILNSSKADIVRTGTELKVPFELTWSCYRDNETACGVCDSCTLRLRGFAGAGVSDQIKYM